MYYLARCSIHLSPFSDEQVRLLERLLDDNLNAYQHGCHPSTQGILASYVLSLLPSQPYASRKLELDYDPARQIGNAHGQTRELGHGMILQRLYDDLASGMPCQMVQPDLENARLYMAVATRVNW